MTFLASFIFAWTSVSCLCRSVPVDHYWTFCREMYMTAVIQHCFRHSTPSVFRIYPVCVQDLSRLRSGSISSAFRIYPVCVQDLSRLRSGSIPSAFRIYPVCVQDLSTSTLCASLAPDPLDLLRWNLVWKFLFTQGQWVTEAWVTAVLVINAITPKIIEAKDFNEPWMNKSRWSRGSVIIRNLAGSPFVW